MCHPTIGVASERLTILNQLVHDALSKYNASKASTAMNPMRQLLMQRYFAKLSQARNVISLVPALVSTAGNSTAVTIASEAKGSPLLGAVFSLALHNTRDRLEKYFSGQITDAYAADKNNGKAAANESPDDAPLDFLKR